MKGRGTQMGAPPLGVLVQRLWWTLVSTFGTFTCGPIWSSHTWWSTPAEMVVDDTGPTAACAAGAATPMTPAASPLAMMVANPNFFTSMTPLALFHYVRTVAHASRFILQS